MNNFATQIFDEHFGTEAEYKLIDKEGDETRQKLYKTNPFRKHFSEIRKWAISDIKDAIIKAIPETDYETYMKHDETYEVKLLEQLTPFISNKISINILYEYHSNDYFNSQNVSNYYYYVIPDEVVKDVIDIKNKKEDPTIFYENDYKIKIKADYSNLIKEPNDFVLEEDEYDYIESGNYLDLTHTVNLSVEFIQDKKIKGRVNINAYLEGDEEIGYVLTIYEMRANPEKKGFGSLALKILFRQLEKFNIIIEVVDVDDEAKEFWEKMYKLGYIKSYI